MRVTRPVEVVCPRPGANLPFGVFGQQIAIHVAGAAGHHITRNDIFADSVFHKMFRSDNLCLTSLHVGLGNHAFDAAPMVDVAVGIDDSHHRFMADVLVNQFHTCSRHIRRDQRIDHHIAIVALDDAHNRQIEATNLINAVGDFEQAVIIGYQPRLPPQAGVDAGRRGFFCEEGEGVEVPDRHGRFHL